MENSDDTISKKSDMKDTIGGGDSEGAKVLSNELGYISNTPINTNSCGEMIDDLCLSLRGYLGQLN